MADIPISGLTALGGAPATNDLLVEVDVSDTTQAPTGTTKKMTVANLFTSPTMTGTAAMQAMTATTGIFSSGAVTISGSVNPSLRLNDGTADGFVQVVAGDINISPRAGKGFTVTGTLGVSSDFAIATSKFTVAAATGNTAIAGTLIVQGAIQSVTGTLNIAGQADFGGVVETTASFNAITSVYKVNSVQVVGARSTGWAAQTVTTGAKTDIGASGTWTTTSVGNLLMAHHAALLAHGLIGT